MATATAPALDPARLNEFIGKALNDMGAAMSAALVVIGDRLGLYKALHQHGPLTSAELAERTGTHERYVREWLANQAAGGYLTYDPATAQYALPEQAFMLADESEPAVRSRPVPGHSIGHDRRAAGDGSVSNGGRGRLARARPSAVRGHRAILPSGLQRAPRLGVASGPRGRDGEARRGGHASPTSDAASVPPPSSWHRRSPGRASSASTTTIARSPSPGSAPRRPGSAAG